MAVDRNGFSETSPSSTGSIKVSGAVLVSLCPLLPSSYSTYRPLSNTRPINMSNNNNDTNLDDNTKLATDKDFGEVTKENCAATALNPKQTTTTIKETKTSVEQTVRYVETERLHLDAEINEVGNKLNQIAIRPEPRVGFYNFIKTGESQVVPSLPACLQQTKYQKAIQWTYDKVPGLLRNSDSLIPKLFSKGIITKSQKERLKATLQNQGVEKQIELLLDIISDKTEEKIIEFIDVIESNGQKELADWIRQAADHIEESRYNSGILSQRQIIHGIGKQSLTKREAIEKSSSLNRKSESALQMVLSTIPIPEPQKNVVPCVSQSGHLIIGLTVKDGKEELVNQVKHSFYKMKSEFTKALNIHCQCVISEQRSGRANNESCPVLMSVEFKAGEKEAYTKLEEKFLDFESYVFQHNGILLTVEEGCIKLTVKVHDTAHLMLLEEDIRSGKVLANMVSWLQKEGYQGSEERPMFMLVVDDDQIQHLKEYLKEADKDPVLNFPVSYTHCPHQNKWMWSADKTHWFDVTQLEVQQGYYIGKKVNNTDCMILEYLAENPAVKPETQAEICIVCGLRNGKEIKESTDYSPVHDRSIDIGQFKEEHGNEVHSSLESRLPEYLSFDKVSNLGLQGLSFIFHVIVDECVCKKSSNDLKNLVHDELQRTFKNFLHESNSAMEFSGDLFDGAGLPFFETKKVTCFFTAKENTVGYQEDIDEGIRFIITEDDDVQPGYLKLKPIGDAMESEFINSRSTMINFIDGLNLLVKENRDLGLIKIEIPVVLQKMKADIDTKLWSEFKRNEMPTYTQNVNEKFYNPTKEPNWIEGKSHKSKKPLPKLKGCFIKQQQLSSYVTPTLRDLSVNCQHINIPLDCNVNLAYISQSWPSCATKWILRPRPSKFPSDELIDDILTEGCRVIPAYDAEHQYLWRFSFENAERKLIQNLPEIYRDVLTLLHVLCSNSFLTCGLPTPYQVKTVFMWACEKHSVENLSKEYSTHFLLMTLDDMRTKMKAKNLPHYFVSGVDLFSEFDDKRLCFAHDELSHVRSNPLSNVFAFARSFEEMPQKKPLDVIFKPVIKKDNSQLSENAEYDCLISLVIQLVAESKFLQARKIFLKLPNAEMKQNCLSKMDEENIMHFASSMPLEDKTLIYEYLTEVFPESNQASQYHNTLAVIYHTLSTEENDQEKHEILSQKAMAMFERALLNPSPAVKVDYAYYLYTSKNYTKAIDTVKQIIKKPHAVALTGMRIYPNFLHPSAEQNSTRSLLLWPLAFALYITIKSLQALDKLSDAKKYLKQLKDACRRIPELQDSHTKITYSSLELLIAAAKDLKEYQISTEAYEQLANLQKVELLVQAQNQATWKLIPQSPTVNPSKVHFPMSDTNDKDFTFDFVQ